MVVRKSIFPLLQDRPGGRAGLVTRRVRSPASSSAEGLGRHAALWGPLDLLHGPWRKPAQDGQPHLSDGTLHSGVVVEGVMGEPSPWTLYEMNTQVAQARG